MNTMLSEIHAADCSAFVLHMFGPHGQPGAIDLDGDDQISFHEFWQAIQADHPKGMNNMMDTFIHRIQHQKCRVAFASLKVNQYQEAVKMLLANLPGDRSFQEKVKRNEQYLSQIAAALAQFCLSHKQERLVLPTEIAADFLVEHGVNGEIKNHITSAMDVDGDGECDFREIAVAIFRFKDGGDRAMMELMFESFDKDKNKTLSKLEVRVGAGAFFVLFVLLCLFLKFYFFHLLHKTHSFFFFAFSRLYVIILSLDDTNGGHIHGR